MHLLGTAALAPVLWGAMAPGAQAAAPSFVDVCTGLSATLPTLTAVNGVTDPLLGGLLAPVQGDLNAVVGNVNTGLQQLNGRTIGVGVLDPATNQVVSVPSNQCNLTSNAIQVTGPGGIALGGGTITALGGTANQPAAAADVNAIALGNGANTTTAATNALALGLRSTVSGIDGVAMGRDSSVTATGGVALGAGSVASRAAETFTDPFTQAAVTTTQGAVSVGAAGAERQIANVADGRLTTDAVNVGQLRGAIQPLAAATRLAVSYTPDGAGNPTPTVSLTNNSALPLGTSQVNLTGVAPGSVTAASRDAINGGQLANAETAIANIIGGGSVLNTVTGALGNPTFTIGGNAYTTIGGALNALASLTIGTGGGTGTSYFIANDDDGINQSTATGRQSVAGGDHVTSSGVQSTAVGSGSQATRDGATAIGGGAVASADPTTAVGFNAAATANEASAFGAYATASGVNSTALGRSAAASGLNATAVGFGSTASGNNSVALGTGSTDGGLANVVSVGAVGAERRIVNVAPGTLSATSTDAVNGSQLYQTNVQVASLGHSAVQYATDANGNTLSTVTLNSDQGGPVIIHNLASGVATSDAATVGQVQAATANSVQYTTVNGTKTNTIALAGGNAGAVTITNLAAGVNPTDAVNVSQLQALGGNMAGSMRDYTDQQVSNLAALTQRQINRVRSDAAGGTALALAATGVRYDDRPGKISVGGATSVFRDQVGLAFGVGGTTEDGRMRFNASVSATPTTTNPQVGAVVGASFSIN